MAWIVLASLVPFVVGLVLLRAGWRLSRFADHSPRSRLAATDASAPPGRVAVSAPEFNETRVITTSAWAAYRAHDPYAYRWPNGKVRFATRYAATKLLLLGFGSIFGFAPMLAAPLVSNARWRVGATAFVGVVAGATIGQSAWLTFAPSSTLAGAVCAGVGLLGLPAGAVYPSWRAWKREKREQSVLSALKRGEIPTISRPEEARAAAEALVEAGVTLIEQESVRQSVRAADGMPFSEALRDVFAQALAFRVGLLMRPTLWIPTDSTRLEGFDLSFAGETIVTGLRTVRQAEEALNAWSEQRAV